jgi:hypothetical protein
MFLIPDYYCEDLTFEYSCEIMKRRAGGDLLKGLQDMDRIWADYIASDDQDDDEFFENWVWEVNAYNKVVENMRPLFV